VPISSSRWEAYPWKNELKLQAERAVAHGRELIDDAFQHQHDPHSMMERAIVLAAFCVRRMIEKRLVTDAYAAATLRVRSFPARSSDDFRPPFRGHSGGSAFTNYKFDLPELMDMKADDLANELIHSSQLMVVGRETFASDGFLVASDWHLKRRVLHLSFEEYEAFTQSALHDQITFASDQSDPETGDIDAIRR